MSDFFANLESNAALARAKAAHLRYSFHLDARVRWLLRDHHADKLLLHTILQLIARSRERSDDADGSGLPSAGELRAAIIPPASDDSSADAQAELERAEALREAVESSAQGLIEHLESTAFIEALDRLEPARRFVVLAELGDGLTESIAGRAYVQRTVARPLSGTGDARPAAPAFHLSRFSGYDGDFLDREDLLAGSKVTAKAFLAAVEHVLPAKFSTIHITELEPVIEHATLILSKLYPVEVLPGSITWQQVTRPADLEVVLHEIRDFERVNPQWLEWLGAGATSLDAVLAALSVHLQLQKLLDDPSLGNSATFATSLAGATKALAEATESIGKTVGGALGRKLGSELGETAAFRVVSRAAGAGSGLDAVLSSIYAIDEFAEGDLGGGFGNLGLGASNLAFLAASGAKVASTGGVFLGLGAFAWTGVGLVLLVGGFVLITFFQDDPDHPLVSLFRQSYFGVGWEGWRPPTGPDGVIAEVTSPRYGWKRRDGSPDASRQVAALMQLRYPVGLATTDEDDEDDEDDADDGDGDGDGLPVHRRARKFVDGQFGPMVVVPISPALAHPNAYVDVRLFDLGRSSHFVLPFARPAAWVGPEWLFDLTSVLPDDGSGGAHWECQLRVSSEVFERAQWVEVTVSPPTELRQQFLRQFGDTLPDELAHHVTLAPRQRVALVEVEG